MCERIYKQILLLRHHVQRKFGHFTEAIENQDEMNSRKINKMQF